MKIDSGILIPRAILALLAILVVAFIFWVEGGLYWLQTSVFSPRRPKSMPTNSVWIDAPPLPISWHHGWWFGCGLSANGKTNYCRLTHPNGDDVYAGEYLPCGGETQIVEKPDLLPPRSSSDMWVASESGLAPVGFLKGGDILVPANLTKTCAKLKAANT